MIVLLHNLTGVYTLFIFLVNFLIAAVLLLVLWFLSKQICKKELTTQFLVQSLFIFLACMGVKNSRFSDEMVINGRISSKGSEHVSCQHSYRCRCYTSCSGGKHRTCLTTCSTCYDHSYDVSWFVNTNTNKKISIPRVDRQGLQTPSRWSDVAINEAASALESYKNFIKAAPDMFFEHTMTEEEAAAYPTYPNKIYDYYKVGHGVNAGMEKELKEFNADLSSLRANFIVVTTNQEKDYAFNLQRAWQGGKQNDIILVLGMGGDKNIRWAKVIGLSYPKFKKSMEYLVMSYGLYDEELFPKMKELTLKEYKMRPMSDFEYLQEAYKPNLKEWIISVIITILITLFLAWFFHENEVYREDKKRD